MPTTEMPGTICLVRPPAVESFRFATTSISPPLGLAYIAGALEHEGYQVRVVDAVGESPRARTRYHKGYLVGMPLEAIVRRIPRDSRLIGVSAIFTHEWPMLSRLISMIKREMPRIPIVVGGEHVTSLPEFCLATSEADVLVLGEGEETIVELAAALEGGHALDLVKGIAFRRGTRIIVNPRRARNAAIDSIAPPAWDHFDLRAYHRHRFVGGMYSASLTVPILATRGCPYQCTYCSAPNMWTPRWIPRDPVQVVDEIESYVHKYGAGNFPFQDLTAIITKQWIVQFASEIIRRRLRVSWQLASGTRSEAVDEEVAQLLRRSGMINMSYAPESGSEQTRRWIKKKMTTDRLMKSIFAAAREELNVAVFLVIGFPHDSEETLRESLPFLDAIVRAGVTDLSVGYYMALPGTELFHYLYASGKIRMNREYFAHILDSLALTPSRSYCESLGKWALLRWKLRLYRRFYGARGKSRARGALLPASRRALSGLIGGASHQSKLQTAVRNALSTGLDSLRCRWRRRWLSRSEESRLFRDWEMTFARLYQSQRQQGLFPEPPRDSRELFHRNIVPELRETHERPRALTLEEPSPPELGFT